MKRFTAILLILVLLVTAGCADSGKKTMEAITGQWTYRLDISEKLTEQLGESAEDMAKYLDYRDLFVEMNMTITPDGGYALSVDEQSVQTMAERVKKQTVEALNAYVTDVYGDLAGLLDVAGLMDEVFPVDEITAGFRVPPESGTVTAKGSELTFTDGSGETESGTYKADTDTLVINTDVAELGITEIGMKRK